MLVIWKGASSRIKLSDAGVAGAIIGTGAGVAVLVSIFFLPYLHRKVVMDDWQLKPWEVIKGPLLLKRGEVPPPPADYQGGIRNYYEGHATKEELEAEREARTNRTNIDPEKRDNNEVALSDTSSERKHQSSHKSLVGPKPEGKLLSIPVLFWWAKKIFLNGVDQDVVSSQKSSSFLTGDLELMHANVEHFDNRAE